jgi:hypothetical protein
VSFFIFPSKSFLLVHFFFNFLIIYLCLSCFWVLLFFFPSAFLFICLSLSYLLLIFLLAF